SRWLPGWPRRRDTRPGAPTPPTSPSSQAPQSRRSVTSILLSGVLSILRLQTTHGAVSRVSHCPCRETGRPPRFSAGPPRILRVVISDRTTCSGPCPMGHRLVRGQVLDV